MNTNQEKTIKIVHISFADNKGGAAIAALRLHKAMLDCGLDSKMVVFSKKTDEIDIVPLVSNKVLFFLDKIRIKVFAELRGKIAKKRGLYSVFDVGNDISRCPEIMNSDIVYLHWISNGTLNYNNIKYLLEKKKNVYWFMHDMFPITGGCHHAFDCKKYQKDCDKCPCFYNIGNVALRQLNKKKTLTYYNNMHWIAPSWWLFKQAEHSVAVNNSRLYHIPNVISNNFFPVECEKARRKLKLSSDKKYILFGADSVLNNPYKGLPFFVEVMKNCYELFSKRGIENMIEVVIFGAESDDSLIEMIPFKIVFMGVVKNEKKMNLLYNAVDTLIVTSTAENYPLVIQEAFFCETPTIAFKVGGIPEIIKERNNCSLIDCFNVTQMTHAVDNTLFHKWEKQYNRMANDDFRHSIVRKHQEVFFNGEK